MPARVVSLDRRQVVPQPGLPVREGARRHVWRGASGREYAHDIYPLLECPPLPKAGYILVRRDESGRCTPLRVGVGHSEAPTLNLAEVRQRAAQAGANEVHVHAGAVSKAEQRLIACDLRAALFGTLDPAGSR